MFRRSGKDKTPINSIVTHQKSSGNPVDEEETSRIWDVANIRHTKFIMKNPEDIQNEFNRITAICVYIRTYIYLDCFVVFMFSFTGITFVMFSQPECCVFGSFSSPLSSYYDSMLLYTLHHSYLYCFCEVCNVREIRIVLFL